MISHPNAGMGSFMSGTQLKICFVGSAAFKLLGILEWIVSSNTILTVLIKCQSRGERFIAHGKGTV